MSDANATTEHGMGGYGGDGELTGYVANVALVYLTMGLGTVLTMWLFLTLTGFGTLSGFGSGGPGPGTRNLQNAMQLAFVLVLVLAPILTTLVAYLVGRSTGEERAALTGAVSNLVGVVATIVILYIFVLLLGQTGAGSVQAFGQLLVGFVGVAIGVTLTGAIGGALGAHSVGG